MGTFEGMIYLQSTKHMALKLFGNNFQILTVKNNVINKLYIQLPLYIIYTYDGLYVKSFAIIKILNNDCINVYMNGIHSMLL